MHAGTAGKEDTVATVRVSHVVSQPPLPLPIALDYRPALLSPAGIGRAVRELARALANRNDVALHLFGHSLARARCAGPVPPGARLHRAPIPGRSLPLLAACGLGAERLAGGVRVFHHTDYVQVPVRAARTVLTVHDLAFVRDPRWHGTDAAVLRERTAAAIAAADAIVVPSRTTERDVRAFAPRARPRVVPFGADHAPGDAAARPHPLGGRRYALCVGTIEPRKNHLALLRAWARLPADRPLLVVVGGIGWECAAIVAALRDAERAGLAQWRATASDAELWPLLAHAELLAYPSLWEGFGFPPLEAMALGVPTVVHDTPALREFGEGVLAFADATDVDALTAALAQALTDIAWRRAAIVAGRARAAGLRWADCAAAHAALYREVAAC